MLLARDADADLTEYQYPTYRVCDVIHERGQSLLIPRQRYLHDIDADTCYVYVHACAYGVCLGLRLRLRLRLLRVNATDHLTRCH